MHETATPSPSVVVGIDGSRNGMMAALWAVDEAVHRDIPLRLVYAIEQRDGGADPEQMARALAAGEIAIRHAVVAVESTDKPVKIEAEILQGRPMDKLLEASRGAAMMCIGAVGVRHATAGPLGSTAASLATRAHCPIAIIRGSGSPNITPTTPGSIVVEVAGSSDGEGVLRRGIDEALLRKAPLVVISVWQAHFTDVHDSHAVGEQNRQIKAQLTRRLARTLQRHPGLDVRPVAVHGSLLNYLSRQAESIQLVIVGRRRAHGVAEMIGPPSYAALHDTECSVLVCDPVNPL